MHRSGECNPLTGFCRVTTETLWEAVSRLEDSGFNYKPCRVVHGGGPHYFLRDTDNGHIIDLTAGQFEDPVPYDAAVCDTDEKRSASKGWAHKRRVRDSAALPGYDMGRGARNTLDRISRSKDEAL